MNSEEEKIVADDIDKILSSTGIITFMAVALSRIEKQLADTGSRTPFNMHIRDRVVEHRLQLRRTAARLKDAAEELGNYLDGCDIVDPTMLAMTAGAFNIIHDRLKNNE